MRRVSLSGRLIVLVMSLTLTIAVAVTACVGASVYYLSEQEIESRLIAQTHLIVRDYLVASEVGVRQREREDGESLATIARSADLSLYIVDNNKQELAAYGIYRDLDEHEREQIIWGKGEVYRDQTLGPYGWYDTYTVPLKFAGETIGQMQVAKQNDLIPILKKSLMGSLLLVLPLVGVVGLGLAYASARRLVRPLQKLVAYLAKVDIQATPRELAVPKGIDYEMGVVITTLNDLLSRLREAMVRQKQITENISHEFKTPLTRIASYLQVGRTKEAEAEVLELGGNVDALLSLALWEGGTGGVSDLVEVIRKMTEVVPASLQLELDLPKKLITPLPLAHARIIWRNVVDNAIKHNRPGGYIKVECREDATNWTVMVKNSAEPKKRHEELITVRKYRAGVAAGYGIGMAIVADVCRLHGLRLEFEQSLGEVMIRVSGKV